MAGDLEGKVAWVTGSSRGIGQAIARRLAEEGASVAIHGSTPDSSAVFKEGESLAAVAKKIATQTGAKTSWVAADLRDPASALAAAAKVEADLGKIDILVTAAGGDIGAKGVWAPHGGKIMNGNDALYMGDEDIRAVWERNFLTCVNTCKAVVPRMSFRQEGWVVTMGSISGLSGIPSSIIYASAKAAVHEYTRCLATQVQADGVHVNCVAPGDITTQRFRASRPLDPSREVGRSLGRYGTADDIADVVAFLVSPGAAYITGQVIRVDGGKQAFPA